MIKMIAAHPSSGSVAKHSRSPVRRRRAPAPSLAQLNNCTDVASLRPTLQDLCARFGVVARLDVLPVEQAGHQQALCFWRMQSPDAEVQIMQTWGIGRFGGDLVMVVDLSPARPAA
jgi:hypothetical protein